MGNQQRRPKGGKGNPAFHRMMNEKRKARRGRSWLSGQERKAARRDAQRLREVENRARRKRGQPTRWEAAKAARWERRHPLVSS